MKAYPQQHTAWRPDYPVTWLIREGSFVYADNEEDLTPPEKQLSIYCWGEANKAIDKAMKS